MKARLPYTQTTGEICVSVLPTYLTAQSNPSENIFVWAYHVCIENKGTHAFQLLSRYWKITDALGRVQEIQGVGVIGKQPILPPGGTFEYASSVALPLPSGVMSGAYQLQSLAGEMIEAVIPLFSLDSPQDAKTVH